MNPDNSSHIHRLLTPALLEALLDTPVVCLLGPRQSGKSTLVRFCDPSRTYISLDDRNYLELALTDPEGFIDGLPDQVAIDEIQRAPELTLAIKRQVDNNRHPGRFLLTGSANLLQLPRLSDSLAGRMECLYLEPLTEAEKRQAAGRFLDVWFSGGIRTEIRESGIDTAHPLPEILLAGGYPEAMKRSPERARRWQQQYLRTIIERDIRDVADVRNGQDMARLLEFLSNQTASLLNVAGTATALGMSRLTVERYMNILEKLFLIRQLPAWHNNRHKRLVKAPKIHVRDSGLCASLSDTYAEQWMTDRKRFGSLLESFVVQQIITMSHWHQQPLRFSHYRDKDQVEVDLVIERKADVWGIEVKAAATVKSDDARGLLRLADAAGAAFKGGLVFYNGNSVIPLSSQHNIYAAPLAKIWEY
jgi:uncharacterized protein